MTMVEVPPEAAAVRQGRGADTPPLAPSRTRTRRGKVRLITLAALDARTAAAHSVRELIATLSADLGGDLSAGEQQLVQRAAMIGAIVADCEARWAAGQQVELAEYFMAVNTQRRVLATLGLRRRPRDVTPPSVADYLAHKAKQREAAS
jgi:hypothetical protein